MKNLEKQKCEVPRKQIQRRRPPLRIGDERFAGIFCDWARPFSFLRSIEIKRTTASLRLGHSRFTLFFCSPLQQNTSKPLLIAKNKNSPNPINQHWDYYLISRVRFGFGSPTFNLRMATLSWACHGIYVVYLYIKNEMSVDVTD